MSAIKGIVDSLTAAFLLGTLPMALRKTKDKITGVGKQMLFHLCDLKCGSRREDETDSPQKVSSSSNLAL